MNTWKKVSDNRIIHVWKQDPQTLDADDEHFQRTPDARVSPDWYQDHGTPIDDNGNDMVYSHTEVMTED